MPKINIISLIVLLTLGFCGVANAQWTYVTAPYGRQLNDVVMLGSNSVVVAGGNEFNDPLQSVFVTSDGGAEWMITQDIWGDWIQGLVFLNSQLGYAVGYNGALIKTLDGGTSWSVLPTAIGTASRHFNGVHFINANIGYAVGGFPTGQTKQTIIRTTNGGADWEVQRDIDGPWLRDVHFVDANTGVAVGDNGTLLRTTDAGSNWTAIGLTGNVQTRDLHAVHFNSASLGIIVGGEPSNDSIQTILRSTDGGAGWSTIMDALGPMLKDVDNASGNILYAVGNRGVVIRSDNGGNDWTSVSIAPSVNDTVDLNAVNFINADFGTAVGRMGKVLRFENPNITAPSVITGLASELTHESVRFNGLVNPNGSAATVTFEYGPTVSLGNTVDAIPSTVSGIGNQEVYADVSGLTTTGLNYFRVRAENSGGTITGQVRPFYIGQPEIPNWNFEYWDTLYTERPSLWQSGGTTSRVMSYDGSWACEFSTQSVPPYRDEGGFVVHGTVDNDQFNPALAIDQRPDSLVAHLKYDVQQGDTAFLLLIFKSATNVIALNTFPFVGSSMGEFVEYRLPIEFDTEDVPDSVLIGMVNTNALADTVFPESILTVDNVAFTGIDYQIPNGDFEMWETRARERPISWNVTDDYRLDETSIVYVTNDASNGDYALQFVNESLQNGFGRANVQSSGSGLPYQYGPAFPISARYTTLNGEYKFQPQGNDTLRIGIAFFNQGVFIAGSDLKISEPSTEYTTFSIPINYQNPSLVPDSAFIDFIFLDSTATGSIATIDNLGFDGFRKNDADIVVGITEDPSGTEASDWIIYPNPSSGLVTIHWGFEDVAPEHAELIDIRGAKVADISLFGKDRFTLDFSTCRSGTYLLRIVGMDGQSRARLLILE